MKKKSEGKEAKTKTARAALAAGHLLQPFTSALLAATCVYEGWATMQCTAERSSSNSPRAGGERTATLILANKPSPLIF